MSYKYRIVNKNIDFVFGLKLQPQNVNLKNTII